jgi:hypothetical protein
VPLEVEPLPPATCTQLTAGAATFQAAQLVPATVTARLPTPPIPGIRGLLVELNVYEASCSTVTAVPATVTVVLRAAPVLAAIE